MESVEETVARLKQRYGRGQAAKYDPDSDQVPQRLLMPGNGDPNLFQVRVKVCTAVYLSELEILTLQAGEEQNLITKIFRKVFSNQNSANPFEIYSAFYRNSLPGMLFVEARGAAPVLAVLTGLVGVFLSTPPKLVPIEEMAPLLKIKKKDENIQPGMWVRMKRGKYAGDLAQVIDVDQITNGVAGLKFIPRIDLTPREKRSRDKGSNGKALGGNVRPPSRLFAYEDVRKIYGRGAIRQTATSTYVWDGDEYVDGFCLKDLKLNLISAEGVKPTLEEVSRFTGDEGETSRIDLSAIADANRDIGASGLFPGDKVEVYEGEQSGLYGPVVTVTIDVIAIKAMNGDVRGQIIEVPSRSVRKRFELGEHVKVLNGPNRDASGMVVDVKGDVVTLMSDQGEQEVSQLIALLGWS
jgi:transcription elongation factor SPT5